MSPGTFYSKIQLPNAPPGTVRLLRVASDLTQSHVICELTTTTLEQAPPYSALSYTWQSALPASASADASATKPPHEIVLNGEIFPVYDNLFQALLRLGQPPHRNTPMWIDYICIDQSNGEEKNHQVDLMGDIYKQADQVIIWLGEDDQHIGAATKLVVELQRLEEAEWCAIDPYNLAGDQTKEILGPEFSQKHYWLSLAHLFRRSWWSRAWVIQEVILASKRLVLCGNDHELIWEHLTTISHHLTLTRWRNAFQDPVWLGFDQHMPRHATPTLLRATERDLSLPLDDKLLRTLIRARKHQCSQKIDKVFSLYGVALRYTPEGVRVPKANYRLQECEAYTETAINILQSSSDLHILAHVEGSQFQEIPNLPSWVPDWSVTKPLGLGMTGHKRYLAAGETARYLEFLQPDTIRLKGACIARINMQGESRHEVSRRSPVTFPSWVNILTTFGETYEATNEAILEAFWRTLIYNTGDDRKYPARRDIQSSFHAWLSQSSEASKLRLYLDDHHSTITEPSLWKVCFSHGGPLRLFRTNEGFLGLGSESLAVGDSVWVVAGSRIPLIMREKARSLIPGETPRYELVGGAYLHGFMHGEALQGMPTDGERVPLKFELFDVV